MPGGRILVVDRDSQVREILARALKGEGYWVEFAERGADGLAAIARFEPDAIVVDLMMSGIKGHRFLTSLRDDMGIVDIPVLVMTSTPGVDPHKALEMGASDVVEKPLDAEEVLNKLALALFRARDEQTSTSEELALAEFEKTAGSGSQSSVVLVIDGDRAMLQRLDELLTERGYTVVAMTHITDELTRLARVLEPRAVVLALDLPGTDGLTALRRLRAEHRLDSIPILLLVDHADKVTSSRADLADLAAEVMVQPVSDEALVAFVSAPPVTAWRSPGAE